MTSGHAQAEPASPLPDDPSHPRRHADKTAGLVTGRQLVSGVGGLSVGACGLSGGGGGRCCGVFAGFGGGGGGWGGGGWGGVGGCVGWVSGWRGRTAGPGGSR